MFTNLDRFSVHFNLDRFIVHFKGTENRRLIIIGFLINCDRLVKKGLCLRPSPPNQAK